MRKRFRGDCVGVTATRIRYEVSIRYKISSSSGHGLWCTDNQSRFRALVPWKRTAPTTKATRYRAHPAQKEDAGLDMGTGTVTHSLYLTRAWDEINALESVGSLVTTLISEKGGTHCHGCGSGPGSGITDSLILHKVALPLKDYTLRLQCNTGSRSVVRTCGLMASELLKLLKSKCPDWGSAINHLPFWEHNGWSPTTQGCPNARRFLSVTARPLPPIPALAKGRKGKVELRPIALRRKGSSNLRVVCFLGASAHNRECNEYFLEPVLYIGLSKNPPATYHKREDVGKPQRCGEFVTSRSNPNCQYNWLRATKCMISTFTNVTEGTHLC
ncbi:hypothetical protein EDB86DRAFT_3114763 [Lactarius hatsudake]|nr:hypothetical protein EDB86DRAFT_3114763 [Lactarius hatsudake]